MELYNITVERQMRLVRVVAGAMGAELNEDSSSESDPYNGRFAPNADVIIDEYDLQKLPFGMGYETIV